MSPPLRFLALTRVAIVVSVLGACADSDTQGGSLGLGINVQLAWHSARTTSGHKLHVGKERVRCAQCHELGEGAVGKASPARCVACHEQESRIHHAEHQAAQRFGSTVKADCTSCHAFTVPRAVAAPPAARTHEPSSAGVGGVPLAVASPGAAGPHVEFSSSDCARCHSVKQGATPAVVVHGSSQCLNCHRPHQDAAPEPGPCAECHRDISTGHAALGKSPKLVCTTCHQHQHAPASDARGSCQPCHAAQPPIVPKSALFSGGHSECVGCHRPHEFEKSSARACRSCHAEVLVLAAPRVPAHNQCNSCHAPHDVRASPQQACAKCHAEVHPNHPNLGPTGNCVGCHDPHPTGTHRRESARACSGCHQTAHADNEFHGGLSCTQCHKPHAFVLAKSERGLCNSCHARETSRVAARSGHQDCASCHRGLPHRPATLLAGCETCHASERHQTRPGHQKCATCHEPHSGAQAAPCQSCHKEQARSAPTGHQECAKCHQPHSGATASACATCHAEQASSKHGQISKDCASCHRPHGPAGLASPPACSSCHQAASLLGLHGIAKHQDCKRCHTGHGDRAGAREVCVTCHVDRKSHFPDAPRCASCHLFDTRSHP